MFVNFVFRCGIAASLVLTPIAGGAADKRPITEKDLFDFVWIGDPQISLNWIAGGVCAREREREEARLRHRDLERGYIDEHKLGVTGGSGGGLLTDWVVTHTQRFAAGVAQRDIASREHWWYTADFTLFQPTWFKGPPFDDRAEFEARSPITYIKNVKTPMMFVLGTTTRARRPEPG
jgi:hypothetical protein